MNKKAFICLFWGLLLSLIYFNVNSISISLSILGYILFEISFLMLASEDIHFKRASILNIFNIVLSGIELYQTIINKPIDLGQHVSLLTWIEVAIMLVFYVAIIYNVFMGIRDMAQKRDLMNLYEETDKRWNQFLGLFTSFTIIIVLLLLGVPVFICLFILAVLAIIYIILMLSFLMKCAKSL